MGRPLSAAERKDCRVCGSTDLTSVLDLGEQPLANAFLREDQLDQPEAKYPLHLVRCGACAHCQLTHVVDPKVLYADYKYRSGVSEGWQRHSEELAQEIVRTRLGAFVLDIGSNDGTLLNYCAYHGCHVLGVDPAHGPDFRSPVPTVPKFWSSETAKGIRLFPGRADVIVAQNVFGHVDDARDFLMGIALVLKADGVAIVECPWVVDLLHKRAFDTIYHEHLSYWGLNPFRKLAEAVGLTLYDVKHFPDIHGGTMRYYLRHEPKVVYDSVYAIGKREAIMPFVHAYSEFNLNVLSTLHNWAARLKGMGGQIAGYGAAAKFNTFLNALPERPALTRIFDDCPAKQGLYTPGRHYPVLAPSDLLAQADHLIIGSPNWKAELSKKARGYGFQGEVEALWA